MKNWSWKTIAIAVVVFFASHMILEAMTGRRHPFISLIITFIVTGLIHFMFFSNPKEKPQKIEATRENFEKERQREVALHKTMASMGDDEFQECMDYFEDVCREADKINVMPDESVKDLVDEADIRKDYMVQFMRELLFLRVPAKEAAAELIEIIGSRKNANLELNKRLEQLKQGRRDLEYHMQAYKLATEKAISLGTLWKFRSLSGDRYTSEMIFHLSQIGNVRMLPVEKMADVLYNAGLLKHDSTQSFLDFIDRFTKLK